MEDTELETVPPCRVLFRDGKPVNDVITSRVARDDSYRWADLPGPHQEARPVGRPRTRPVKAKPHAGEGKGWGRRSHVTVDRIRELRAAGVTFKEIGRQFGCRPDTVYKRLRDEARRNPKVAEEVAASRRCPSCGERKWARNELCQPCTLERLK